MEDKGRGIGGFMETFDASLALANSGYVAARLASGSKRDEAGRFRIAPGTSSLRAAEPKQQGISVAQLQEMARRRRRRRTP